MSPEIKLSLLRAGETARIVRLDPSLESFGRLTELGFYPNGELEYLFCGCMGEPRAYLAGGSVYALRRETAEKIIVKSVKAL